MYFYIIATFLMGWLMYPIVKKNYSRHTANGAFLLLLFPVCLFAMGFRDTSVGVDTSAYKMFFDNYVNYSWNRILFEQLAGNGDTVELGMRVLMKSCSMISPNYFFYQFVFGAIYLGLFFIWIYKYTSNAILGVAFFLGSGLYMYTFNVARQMLAIAIIAFAMTYLIERKFIKSLLIVGLAYFFHSSSLFALVMFFIYPFRNNKCILYATPAALVIIVLSVDRFILPLAMNLFGDKYLNYIINDFSRPNKGVILQIMWIITMLVSTVCLFKQDNSILRFLAILSLGGAACYWVGLSINYVDRVGYTFLPAILLLYDQLGKCFNKRNWKILYINGFSFFYLFYFGYWTFINESVVYKSILE